MTGTPRARIFKYIIAAVVLTAGVWALGWWYIHAETDREYADSARSAQRLAIYFERQTLSIFRYGDAYLNMVRREYASDFDLEAVVSVMNDVPLDTSIVSHVTIINADGTPVFNSGYGVRPDVRVTDRDYFVRHRDRVDTDEDSLFVSPPHRGRNSGKLVVRLVRRIATPDGGFGGVIFAALDAASITEFFNAMNLGQRSSATLVGMDKRIRARSSYGRLGPGQDISGSRIWTELEKNPIGHYMQTSVVDDVTRHYAYRKLAEFPLVVAIGVAVEDIATQVSGYRLPAYTIAALATVLIAVVTALLSREVLASERVRASEAEVRTMRDQLEVRVARRTAELEAVQADLRRADRLAVLGRLTGSVAHELRNPLSTIDTSLSVLEKRLHPVGEEQSKPIERIHRNVARCNNIITDLLDFTRMHRIAPVRIGLDAWLVELLAELPAPEGVTRRFEPGATDVAVALDSDRLRRAIINLLDNARDAIVGAGQTDGEIRISTRIEGDGAQIEIADNGPGISADDMQHIRDPLFSTKSFGIGLGLSIVEQTIQAHGGSLELASVEGDGTRARVWLPLDAASAGPDT